MDPINFFEKNKTYCHLFPLKYNDRFKYFTTLPIPEGSVIVTSYAKFRMPYIKEGTYLSSIFGIPIEHIYLVIV